MGPNPSASIVLGEIPSEPLDLNLCRTGRFAKEWRPGTESNLSRFAGVSEAGARRRNPERREGPPCLNLSRTGRFANDGGQGRNRTADASLFRAVNTCVVNDFRARSVA